MDMEIIARVSNCLCFSACVSSSTDFKTDVLSGINFGDTVATWERFIKNETLKSRPFFLKEERLYFDVDHISRYKFDGAHKIRLSKIQSLLEECWKYKNTPSENWEEKDESLKKLMAFANRKEKYKMILDDIKMRFGIVFTGDVAESDVGVSS